MNDAVSMPFDYEADLVACARGDRSALRRIYEQEASRLLGVALRILRRRDLANDALHDAFLQIWEKSGSFDPGRGAGRAWIFSVVRHRALNMLRDHSREGPIDEAMLAEIPDSAADPAYSLSLLCDAQSLKHCLEALGPSQRTSILLAYVDGYSHAQVAQRLNASRGAEDNLHVQIRERRIQPLRPRVLQASARGTDV
jgi:RNA polymerase sigma-70 factor (ECF subfamily)